MKDTSYVLFNTLSFQGVTVKGVTYFKSYKDWANYFRNTIIPKLSKSNQELIKMLSSKVSALKLIVLFDKLKRIHKKTNYYCKNCGKVVKIKSVDNHNSISKKVETFKKTGNMFCCRKCGNGYSLKQMPFCDYCGRQLKPRRQKKVSGCKHRYCDSDCYSLHRFGHKSGEKMSKETFRKKTNVRGTEYRAKNNISIFGKKCYVTRLNPGVEKDIVEALIRVRAKGKILGRNRMPQTEVSNSMTNIITRRPV